MYLDFVESGTNDGIISYFDGTTARDIFTTAQPIRVIGVSEDGLFLRSFDGSNLATLIGLSRDGVATNLNPDGFALETTAVVDDKLWVFTEQGIFSYDVAGTETIVEADYAGCACGEFIAAPVLTEDYIFYPLGDAFQVRRRTGDLVASSILSSAEALVESNGVMFGVSQEVLKAFNLTDLVENDLNRNNEFVEIERVTKTTSGIVFFADDEDGVLRELYGTDGTVAGTRYLAVDAPSSIFDRLIEPYESGRNDAGVFVFTGFQDDGEQYQLYATDGTLNGTLAIADPFPVTNLRTFKVRAVDRLSDGSIATEIMDGRTDMDTSLIYNIQLDGAAPSATLVASLETDFAV
ncbi:hypothetical protein [Lewinella sp. 4G2]|uniref:hypothetical protein n=1 Tax=Lewinella sp. 4G2 TaxID=1803372 RepID=UPI0007B467BF|nr:hypothetical protein [Lewinella sp. 4G2]OAV44819.1 hypothetical protein A3850_010105 [Lewinella sp. 4G2]